MATYKVVNDIKVSQHEGLVISYLDRKPDLHEMSLKLVCDGQIYNYSLVFDAYNAIVIHSPDSFVGRTVEFIPKADNGL